MSSSFHRIIRTLGICVFAAALGAPGFVHARPVEAAALAAVPPPASAAVPTASSGAALWDPAALGTIDRKVFDLGMAAADCAVQTGVVKDPPTLSIIDYSKASTVPRLWVYDLKERSLLFEELVAHGQGSGGNVPTRFSNEPDTHASSLGLFLAEGTVVGETGYSLLLKGLDAGFNDNALARGIIMHGAWYVSEAFAKAQGYLGRSWGCPAVSLSIARTLIDRIKNGGLVFAYYPDGKWLASSRFVGSCGVKHPLPATAGAMRERSIP